MRIEVAANAGCELGESPVWDASCGELIWVDVDNGIVHRRSPAGELGELDAGQPVGCAWPRAGGGLVLALRDGFALSDTGQDHARLAAPVERERRDTRMNDGACDPQGRFWAGTMSLCGDTGTAALYRLDPDLAVTRVLGGLSVSNGIGWSPDGEVLYHVDSPRSRIDVHGFDGIEGSLAGPRGSIRVDPAHGRPDGLAVDSEGGIWLALWGGAAVQRYSPAGELVARVELPATHITSCCFGGPDLGTLYVTSARRRAAHEPLAGAVFACRPGVAGLPGTAFAG